METNQDITKLVSRLERNRIGVKTWEGSIGKWREERREKKQYDKGLRKTGLLRIPSEIAVI